jgi:hypothetical protein
MSSTTNYAGSCHCGAVAYRVDLDLTKPVMSCNCSICRRVGSLLAFVPPGAFQLENGEDALTDYQFNRHNIHHLFCKTCGIKSFARGTGPDGNPMVAINVRCLHEVEPDTLTVRPFDGKKL